jgi:hypothetical protein
VGEVMDFMPIEEPERATANHRLIRIMRVVRGQMRFVLECEPRAPDLREDADLREPRRPVRGGDRSDR